MPIHGDILLHMEIAGTYRQITISQPILTNQGQVIHKAAHITHIGVHIGAVIQILPVIQLTGIRAVGVTDFTDGRAVHH